MSAMISAPGAAAAVPVVTASRLRAAFPDPRAWAKRSDWKFAAPPAGFWMICGAAVVGLVLLGLHPTSLGLDKVRQMFTERHKGWVLTHASMHFVLAVTFPQYVPVAVAGGVAWECFEALMYALMLRADRDAAAKYGTPMPESPWWYGNAADIGFNAMGTLAGLSVLAAYNTFAAPAPAAR